MKILNSANLNSGSILVCALAVLGILTGCASASRVSSRNDSGENQGTHGQRADARKGGSSVSGKETLTSEDSRELTEEILSADAEIEPGPHSQVPLEINDNVQKWINYFTQKDRNRFTRFLERGQRYKELVQKILTEVGVPREMYYLAMIESGYVTHARSPANAVGAWQFMRATGKLYGLKTNPDLDERRDIIRSTRAAARYLKTLHDHFDSWYLALASYNAGDGRIRRAIRKGKTRDFWLLVKRRALPRETMNYVPKFLAAVIVARNQSKYGIEAKPDPKMPEVKSVEVPPSVHLRDIASSAEIPLEELQELNPHLVRDITPRGNTPYSVWIPEAKAETVEGLAFALPKYQGQHGALKQRRFASNPEDMQRATQFHRVRRGDTLISIARRYGLSVAKLRELNQMSSNSIRAGQRLRVVDSG